MQTRTVTALLASLLLSSCSSPSAQVERQPTATDIARLIKGTWCTPEQTSAGCAGYDYVIDDRTVIACGKLRDSEEIFSATSQYTIDGNKICYKVISSTDTRAMSAGDKFCAEIVKINDSIEIYRFVGETREFTIRRVQGPPPCAGGT